MTADLKYVVGDATRPVPTDEALRIITHCCNDKGAWGAGFVVALSARWPEPEECYRQLVIRELGIAHMVPVERAEDGHPTIVVANIIGQRGTRSDVNTRPVRYDAIHDGLENVRRYGGGAASYHMPRMGAGLAGGAWPIIEAIIHETMKGLSVWVYDLEPVPGTNYAPLEVTP